MPGIQHVITLDKIITYFNVIKRKKDISFIKKVFA